MALIVDESPHMLATRAKTAKFMRSIAIIGLNRMVTLMTTNASPREKVEVAKGNPKANIILRMTALAGMGAKAEVSPLGMMATTEVASGMKVIMISSMVIMISSMMKAQQEVATVMLRRSIIKQIRIAVLALKIGVLTQALSSREYLQRGPRVAEEAKAKAK